MEKSNEIEVSLKEPHSICLPEEALRPFLEGKHSRVLVRVRFEGKTLKFHAALQRYQGNWQISFSKRKQKVLGVYPGDYFHLQLFEDQSRYGVDIPEELEAVLISDPEAREIFEGFTPGKKRSIIYAIAAYARSQTRIDKSLLLCDNLRNGIRINANLLKSGGQ